MVGIPNTQQFIHFQGSSGPLSLPLNLFLSEGNFPKYLYKYRTWFGKHSIGNENWKDWRWLYECEVFMTAPANFPDKKEFRNFASWHDLTDVERNLILPIKIQEHSNEFLSYPERAKIVDDILKQGHLQSKDYSNKMIESWKAHLSRRIGVCSFCKSPSNQLMWDQYSNCDTGFCIEFNAGMIFQHFGGGGHVLYPEGQLPQAHPRHTSDEQTHLLIYHKEREYEFEDEYRTIILNEIGLDVNQRAIKLPKSAYHSVVVGRNCGSVHFAEIMEAVEMGIGPIKHEREDLLGRIQLFL